MILQFVKVTLIAIFFLYVLICVLLYAVQENLIFHPTKLPKDHLYSFPLTFREINHEVEKGIQVNSLLFHANDPKGVVLYLHGNAGDLDSWGEGAGVYTENGFDVLYVDYRGYGKSDGHIQSEQQLVSDVQVVYDFAMEKYGEDKIIVSGTSIGSGLASQLAAKNSPAHLILISPYYSLQHLIREKFPILPPLIIRYKLLSYKYVMKMTCPITLFHGTADQLIPATHSKRLSKENSAIDLQLIQGAGHNDIQVATSFMTEMKAILLAF